MCYKYCGGNVARIIFNIASVIFLILFLSCSKTDKKETIDYSSLLTTQTYNLEKQTGDCSTEDAGNCAIIQIEYLEVFYDEYPAIQEKINSRILNELLKPFGAEKANETFEDMMLTFIEEYINFKKEFPKSQQLWKLERVASELFNSNNIFCCEILEYSFLGGAHPNSLTKFLNFDLSTGNELELKNLLIDGYLEKINIIGEKIFRQMNEIEPNKDLTEAGFWFDNDKFSINNNFTVDENGITFYYNNYEITDYASGPTDLYIPYDSIKNLIKPDGLLGSFIGN